MSVVFITGATKNSGLATAEKFAKNGFDVALSSRRLDDAEKTAKYLAETYKIKAKGYALDLTDPSDIERVFKDIKLEFGRLDTFVANSANLGVGLGILNSTPDDFDSVVDVNLKGTFFCTQQAGLIMKEQGGGAIVYISSVHSKACIQDRGVYSISKGGVNTLATAVTIDLGKYNIRANTIIAGAIKTERWESFTEEQVALKRKNWPLGLESTGEDIANAAYYLGTDLSKTVSGTELAVDSGILCCLLAYNGGN